MTTEHLHAIDDLEFDSPSSVPLVVSELDVSSVVPAVVLPLASAAPQLDAR